MAETGSLFPFFRKKAERDCDHDWRYDAEETAGPWTGYIERCVKCNALQQVPQ